MAIDHDLTDTIIGLASTVGEVKSLVIENRNASAARDNRLDGFSEKLSTMTETMQRDRHHATQRDQLFVYRLEAHIKICAEHKEATELLAIRVRAIETAPRRFAAWLVGIAGSVSLMMMKIQTEFLDHWPPRWWPKW